MSLGDILFERKYGTVNLGSIINSFEVESRDDMIFVFVAELKNDFKFRVSYNFEDKSVVSYEILSDYVPVDANNFIYYIADILSSDYVITELLGSVSDISSLAVSKASDLMSLISDFELTYSPNIDYVKSIGDDIVTVASNISKVQAVSSNIDILTLLLANDYTNAVFDKNLSDLYSDIIVGAFTGSSLSYMGMIKGTIEVSTGGISSSDFVNNPALIVSQMNMLSSYEIMFGANIFSLVNNNFRFDEQDSPMAFFVASDDGRRVYFTTDKYLNYYSSGRIVYSFTFYKNYTGDSINVVANDLILDNSSIKTVATNLLSTNSSIDIVAEDILLGANSSILNAKDNSIIAMNSAESAAQSSSESSLSAVNANLSAISANESESNSAINALSSEQHAENSRIYSLDSETAKNSSILASDKSQQWADNDVDVEVESGKYSAKHWATKSHEAVLDFVNDIEASTTTIYSSSKVQELHDAQAVAIASLATAQGQIKNSTLPAVANILTIPIKLDFDIVSQSSNTAIFEIYSGTNVFTFRSMANYIFLSTVVIKSHVSAGRTITFNLKNTSTDEILVSSVATLNIANGDTESISIATLLPIASIGFNVKVEVSASDSGYELVSFNSILASSVGYGSETLDSIDDSLGSLVEGDLE